MRITFMLVIGMLGAVVGATDALAAPCAEGANASSCQCGARDRDSGFCCDTTNGDNGVWFRGDFYDACPMGDFRYVSENGDNNNDGQTPATAWRTINKLNNSLGSGDTGIILGGSYNERNSGCEGNNANLRPPAGTAAQSTVIKGHPDLAKPVIRANTGGGHFYPACGTSYLVLDGIEITDSQGGVRTVSGNNVVLQDLYIHDIEGDCGDNNAAIFFGYFGAKKDIIVRNNHIKNTPHDSWNCGGVVSYEGDNLLIENNVIENTPSGVVFKGGEKNSVIRRNVFKDLGAVAILRTCNYGIGQGTGSDPGFVDVYENVFFRAASILLYNDLFQPCGNNGGGIINDDRFFNNTFYTEDASAIVLDTHGGNGNGNYYMDNISIINNLFYDYDDTDFDSEEIAVYDHGYVRNFHSDHNLYSQGTSDIVQWCADFDGVNDRCDDNDATHTIAQFYALTGNEEHSLRVSDPAFEDTTYGAAHFLKPAEGSAAIDAGTIIANYHCPISADVDPAQSDCKLWCGNAPDIGAYEYCPGFSTCTPRAEICGNGLDDDCDGTADNGCPTCGDDSCNGSESCSTCAIDCGACPAVCGDDNCNGNETCSSCEEDCGVCPASCGDSTCDNDETRSNCPGDCGACAPICGDATCEGSETCDNCESDCGVCTGEQDEETSTEPTTETPDSEFSEEADGGDVQRSDGGESNLYHYSGGCCGG